MNLSAEACRRFQRLKQTGAVTGLLILLGCTFLGCPPRDPLDGRVRAETETDYDAWVSSQMTALPRARQEQMRYALHALMTATPELSRASTNTDLRPYLAKLDGRTMREILIDGYESANLMLRRDLVLRSDNLARVIERGAMLPTENAGEEAGTARRTEVARQIIQRLNETIAANEAVIRELREPASR